MMQTYFYKAFILRDGGRRVCREGTVQAAFPENALDKLVGYAINEWKKPLQKIELYEINENGALVATSTIQDRIGAVCETHKAFGSTKYKTLGKIVEEKRGKNSEPRRGLQQALPPPPEKTEAKSVHVKATDWVFKVGSYDNSPQFATMKLTEGAFK